MSANDQSVAILIPTRGKAGLVRNCLRALLRAVNPEKVDVLVLEQGGEESKELIEAEFEGKPVRWMKAEDGWSYADINNEGVKATTAPFVLCLNNDTQPKKGFLDRMLEQMEDEQVAIVGAKLLFPTGKIQHVGVIFKSDGVPTHIGYGRDDGQGFGPAERDDDYDAVTFACALVRRTVWDELGGLDPEYYFNYEDTDFCLKAREKGYRIRLAHRAVVTHLEGASGEDRKSEKHSVKRNLGILLGRWFESGRMEKALGVKMNRREGVRRSELANILFMPSGRAVGVPWWRMEQPARMIGRKGLANVQILYPDSQSLEYVKQMFSLAEVVVTHCFWNDWMHRLAAEGVERNFAVVYDHDDHPIHMSPFAQAYRHFGTQEVKLQSSDGAAAWLWRDGDNGFDVARNIDNRQKQLEILHMVDMVTTTTPLLTNYLKTLNPNVVMIPNAIDFSIFRRQTDLFTRKPGPVRIGWHGGDNHFHDVSEVGPWLTEYVNAHDVQLVLFGAYYKGPFRGIDENKVVEEEWVNVEAFPWKLAQLGLDVGVIPLADPALPYMQFGAYKSELKYLEFSALGIPSLVCGNRAPYYCCTDGDNALVYGGREEFLEKLDRLCRDADLRTTIADRAYDWVREHRDLEKVVERWVEMLERASVQFAKKKEAAFVAMEAAKNETVDAADAVPDSDLRPAGAKPEVVASEGA